MGEGGTAYISKCLSDSRFKTNKSRKSWTCLSIKAFFSKKNDGLLAKEKEVSRLPLGKKNVIDFISF